MPKQDVQKRIDLRRQSGASDSTHYQYGSPPTTGTYDDEQLVRRDGAHSLYGSAQWLWEKGATANSTLQSWGKGMLRVVGQLWVGRKQGPRAGLLNYTAEGTTPSFVLEATDSENVPVFSAGALDNADPDDAWVNIGRENYPRIHFGELAGYDRRVPLVDAELVVGTVQPWQINTEMINPLLDHGLLQGLPADDHQQYHTDARGDARYARLNHFHGAPEIYLIDAGHYYASEDLEGALAEAALYFATGPGVTDHGALTGLTDQDHPATAITIADAAGYFVGTDVEAALTEIGRDYARFATFTHIQLL